MENQPQSGVPGPAGRRLHIAHRRSPSEMTPMIMEQLALQQQIELLQQQQQQIAATHQQYVNMGMIPQQQQLPTVNFPSSQMPGTMAGLPGHPTNFQFPQQLHQQGVNAPLNAPSQPSSHRRNQSALPGINMGPPPAPSSGTAGSAFAEFPAAPSRPDGNANQRGRGGGPSGGGHQRRHSLALPEAKKAAEIAQSKRTTSGFQFPIPGAAGASTSSNSPSQNGQASQPAVEDEKGTPHQRFLAPQPELSNRAGNRGIVGHGRSQSMATGNGRGTMLGQGRGAQAFQFPPPMATNDAGASAANQADFQRRGISNNAHARTSSRNFEGNWRQQNNGQQTEHSQPAMGNFSQPQNPQAPSFQPSHRTRGSTMNNQSISSLQGFSFAQPQLVQLPQGQVMLQPQLFAGQQLNPLQISQLQALQAAQLNGQGFGLQSSQHAPQLAPQQQQQQQRKTLFTPYLPQASLPALLSDGQLVAGILRVNKKNRSDAYVTTDDLDADIFICGSKDRNRALEGDLVAIELLDVDEVWGQKREKEEKKKRKDITDNRMASANANEKPSRADSASANDTAPSTNGEGGIRRRGSLRQRPTQKKNDDVEVEGQSLLLMEEEEVNDEQKPLYAGHVVAVVERMAGQMFSGTLGLLRPSSQATKEKQEAERQTRDGSTGRHQQERHQDKPKIVWFKPTDKRVPLIAIPTEQAPRDFVERHQDYANRIFVACIKRWPITSLHPFGTLVEQLGEMGDLKVETDALLRDNNFGPDDFSDAVSKNVGFDDWSVASEKPEHVQSRRDFRHEVVFTVDPTGSEDLDDALHVKDLGENRVQIGVHVADAAHFIRPNSLVDREAKKRGTGVYLMNRAVSMLPPRLASNLCSLSPGQERFTVSVLFEVDLKTGTIDEEKTWIGKAIINSSGKLSYEEVDKVIRGDQTVSLQGATTKDIEILQAVAQSFRKARYHVEAERFPSLRLLYQLDDENVPVEHNLFDSTPAHEIIEEVSYKTNAVVAQKILQAFPEKALLRRHAPPKPGRLRTFAERMTKIGYEIDTSSSGSLQNSLFKVKDDDMRKGMETLLVKTMSRAKYVVAGRTRPDLLSHFALNLPVYTHFTNPSRRYAAIVVHRQLEAALSNGAIEFNEDIDSLVKTAEQCNVKKDSAQSAQEQSVHIESCRMMDKKHAALGDDLISEGVVICVYESAFDVLIPEYGFEKRVHCDQLPLKKAEFRKETRVLELYWEKGVTSTAYVPEDERPKGSSRINRTGGFADPSQSALKSKDDVPKKQIQTDSMSTDDVEALFENDDDDDNDGASEIAEMTAGVSLGLSNDRPTQSTPQSPTSVVSGTALQRTQSESKISSVLNQDPESKLTKKERYLGMFRLREEGGEHIQDVTEMTRVPVILKTDLTKSPPCLTIRSVNPYAL